MLMDDPRFVSFKNKHAEEEQDDLVAQMAKLTISKETDLDLRPLSPAQLSSFAAVAEFIQAFKSVQKDDAFEKAIG